MRPGMRGRLTARVVLILTIAAGIAIAIAGAGAAMADTSWGYAGQSVDSSGSVAAQAAGEEPLDRGP